MIRIVITVVQTLFLTGCSTLPDWIGASFFPGAGHDTEAGQYSFDWTLSGDRQVAPLQVFDNGKKTWLQFLPDQPVPAIFQVTPQGKRPVSYVRQDDYLILQGVWSRLSFRGGSLAAYAQQGSPEHAVSPPDAAFRDDSSSGDAAIADHMDKAPGTSGHDLEIVGGPDMADVSVDIHDEIRQLTHSSFVPLKLQAPVETPYGVTMQDQTLRNALSRWTRQANWTFNPEHWAVDVDIPISGEAVFGVSFQDAVQDLLSATELAERPLRPCFYSNQVLRVVSYSQSCDRFAGDQK